MSQDPNLPFGCTNADIDRAVGGETGEEECETCGGTGSLGSECCGAKVTEAGLCEKCKKTADEEKCQDCKCEGIVEFSVEERRREAKEAALEDREDERRLGL